MKHLAEEELTLLYFGEGADAERLHLGSCRECQARLDQLTRFLDALRAVPVPELRSEWDGKLWAGIAPEVTRALDQSTKSLSRRRWLAAPALAGLLGAAFFAGMYTQHHLVRGGGTFSPQARERVLLIALGDHLDRSQIVLAELVNSPEGKYADISAQQQLAGHLVSENRLLRQAAVHSGDRSNAAVLEQLERVLIEIAHAPSNASPAELEELRQRIDEQGLLFKVRVVSTNDREKGMKL